ncbi:hypothetical protein ORV05_34410 [Amycolatopsis cynarae]|uniref:Uncharacterized protein n=1 Tax=Amycolatopsis cynarae TaxID=2995223 RepID=A0ABY7B1Q3_9PSEU|nr:hypothetical protein [Amycolatopsis sp. HUAS 11-8]WAL65894.1 hypothetical protein ORV05_34410 [Amycolatopsis sp. HUAS 11-8]
MINSRALLVGDHLSPPSFDEMTVSILYAQLRAIHDTGQGGTGSNSDAPEGRDPKQWLQTFRNELGLQGWAETGSDVSAGFAPVSPEKTALGLVGKKFTTPAPLVFGWRLLDPLAGLGMSAAGTFGDATLDGGPGEKRLVRCRMFAEVGPGDQGRELFLAFLVLSYPREPAPGLGSPFDQGTTYWLPAYGYRLNEKRFREVKDKITKKIGERLNLVVRASFQ